MFFSSVLHAITTDLIQHELKRDIEEHLVSSGLEFTILQPANFAGDGRVAQIQPFGGGIEGLGLREFEKQAQFAPIKATGESFALRRRAVNAEFIHSAEYKVYPHSKAIF